MKMTFKVLAKIDGNWETWTHVCYKAMADSIANRLLTDPQNKFVEAVKVIAIG